MGKILNKICLILFVFISNNCLCQGTDYISFPMMNLEIRHTLEEHDRQVDMHEKQILNTLKERQNRTTWENVKEVKRKIQKRLSIIDFTLQGIPTGYQLLQDSQRIYQIQESIFEELEDSPEIIANVFNEQINFVNEVQMTMRFILGIVASYGAINQMERAERQILLDHALNEVKMLKNSSISTLLKIRDIKDKIRLQNAIINYQIDRDKQVVEDIIENIGL